MICALAAVMGCSGVQMPARPFRRLSSRTLVLIGALLTLVSQCPVASASDASRDLTQYVHTAWSANNGLKGSVRAIVQTPDGYLWLGTEFGLVRFDGVRFVPAGTLDQPLSSMNILSLLAGRDGTIWIGTLEGLASWHEGKLNPYPELAGVSVFALLEDREGTVWIGTESGICAIGDGKPECDEIAGARSRNVDYLYRHASRGSAVYSLYEDGERRLWAGTESGLWQWKPGPPHRGLQLPILAEQGLVQGEHATGLVSIAGDDRRLVQIAGSGRESYPFPGIGPPVRPQRLLRDRDGGLWIGTLEHGLLHFQDGTWSEFAQTNGLSSNLITALFEDREGNIWVGTTNGLDRFNEPAASTISSSQRLVTPALSVLAAQDGSLWIASYGGLNRWREGQLTIFRATAASASQTVAPDKPQITEIVDSELPDNAFGSLFEDARGRIWVSTRDGAGWFENGAFTRAKGVPGGSAIAIFGHTDDDGVWIASPASGLFHVVDGAVAESAPWPWFDDARKRRLSTVAAEPTKDGVWLGFLDQGIAYFKDGQIQQSLGSKDGLDDTVWNLHFDHAGTLWAATDGGLSRINEGRVATLSVANGLPCDAVHWVIEDDDFALWLYTACGLMRVDRAALDDWASNAGAAIHPIVFDATDGIRVHTLVNGFSPVVTKSADGKIWFVHGDGVSVIDPYHLRLNPRPPPVHIEQFIADGRTYPATSGLRLPPRVRDLSIEYTALSLVAPEKVRFRFKLEGQDRDWREVVNDRQVQYSNLAPRSYRFRVSAANNSGVWNEEGAAIDFTVAPAYWQTTWFGALCAAAFAAVLWALYRLRLRYLAQEFERGLDARVAERTRIARELHDTLLQSFHGLLLRFQSVWDLLPTRPTEAKEMLGSAIDQAANAITEGREAVEGLRTSTEDSNDLALAIRTLGEQFATDQTIHHPPAFRVDVEGTPRAMHPIVRDEIYRIAGEALRNAFQHSRGTQIEVEIRHDERQFRLRVRDDGKGIDAKVLAEQGREGHYGLRGLRERVELIGGNLSVWSAPGEGTEVELSVPAARAYAPTASHRIDTLKAFTWQRSRSKS